MLRALVRTLPWVGPRDGEYVCRGCGSEFRRRRQVCPDCESYRVERREW